MPSTPESTHFHLATVRPDAGRQQSLSPAQDFGPCVVIEIAWPRSIEHIIIYLEQLCEDCVLETVEYGKDGFGEVTYEALCTGADLVNGKWIVNLSYDRDIAVNRILAQSDSTLQWGQTTLTINEDLSKAEAVFRATDNSVTRGLCTVRNATLLQGLTTGVATVLLRPGQAALRSRLLRKSGTCAISNESITAVLEVAHIIRHADRGAAHERNAILLRADLHRLFDSGAIDIRADGSVDLKDLSTSLSYRREIPNWNATLPHNVLKQVQAALHLRSSAGAADAQ